MIDITIAVILDFFIGDPPGLPHPVRFLGKLIVFEEKQARRMVSSKKGLIISGLFIVIMNMLVAYLVPFAVLRSLKKFVIPYHIINIYLLYSAVAAGCLRNEAMKIYDSLRIGIEEARYRLSFIVGRDTNNLNEGEIIRATVETVAENTSDGVIAPLLFAMIFGAPGAWLYKSVNTMDSMLGYMNAKYRWIGFFPAKTDDLFNYVPARLTGALMSFSGLLKYNVLRGFEIMIRDRKNHKSPNCAYSEGAVAGLLGVQLGGSNSYFGEIMDKPKIGDFFRQLYPEDIKRTIDIMFRAELLLIVIYVAIGVIF